MLAELDVSVKVAFVSRPVLASRDAEPAVGIRVTTEIVGLRWIDAT